MNTFVNVKTLQFGPNKCKALLVGKDTRNVLNNDLYIELEAGICE
jgi:hypothetical protein